MDLPNLLDVCKRLSHRVDYSAGSENIQICCPLAGYEDEDGQLIHSKGRDRRPSLSIKVNPHDRSVFKCFSCQHQGTLQDLVDRLNWLSEGKYTDVLEFVHEREEAIVKKWGGLNQKRFQRKRVSCFVYTEAELNPFKKFYHPYLKKRGITKRAFRRWELLWDPKRERILFPIRNKRNQLIGMHSRRLEEKEYRPVLRFDSTRTLYGEQFLNDEEDYLILVEGNFDTIVLYDYGFHVQGLFGCSLRDGQADKVAAFDGEIFLLFDGDKGGREGAETAWKKLKKRGKESTILDLEDGEDPDDLKAEEIEELMGWKSC